MDPLDQVQAASAAQFDRQSSRYGKTHILADTMDIEEALRCLPRPVSGQALDVATGGGHTALALARMGYAVTLGDVSERMLEAAGNLLHGEGYPSKALCFPAEAIPFPDAAFDLVSSRVAPHHFSSPTSFVRESMRVLRPGGWFLLIDGSLENGRPEVDRWLNQVEKWRDPSHGRLLSQGEWEQLVGTTGFTIIHSRLNRLKQPDLEWYFDTAGTSPENREKVRHAIQTASPEVRSALRLAEEAGKLVWWWPRLTLLARKPELDPAAAEKTT